ncbi:DUF3885 domain-containing protein [Flavobacterium orientale]|uniref:DUF3885 domain-containing protein n=1 Tax=Flavobacterium orientale TaxID=1756020 RepID=A0A916YA15_9FLAO|nr:DUF3885 domain-containing protein [Flavobacterium orientale]GGD36435.1 hypothetical protein GCM10011343_27870 [Flavobacterium orientale]
MTTKQEYRKFLNDNFKGLRLRKPLFYSWDFGLRFDLQVGKTDTDEYFQEVTRRASTIFKTAFADSDNLFLVFMDYKYKRRKIRFSNFSFKQINSLEKTEISYSKELQLYEPDDKFDIRNIAIIKLATDRINYKNILKAIGHTDFPSRQPRLDQNGFLTGKEIYFVNIDKKLIFHMYDDRGLDIISADKETLRPIYKKHNDWILDYDREQIDKQFE